jgi:hypothetical protein
MVIAGLAAWAAVKAARAANAANEQNRAMANEGRERRARSVAGTLRREIEELMRTITPYYAARAVVPPQAIWTVGAACKSVVNAPLLERMIERWDDFDEKTSGRLGSLVSAISKLRGPFDVQALPDDIPEHVLNSFVENMAKDFDRLTRCATLASEALEPYSAVDEELDNHEYESPFAQLETEAVQIVAARKDLGD